MHNALHSPTPENQEQLATQFDEARMLLYTRETADAYAHTLEQAGPDQIVGISLAYAAQPGVMITVGNKGDRTPVSEIPVDFEERTIEMSRRMGPLVGFLLDVAEGGMRRPTTEEELAQIGDARTSDFERTRFATVTETALRVLNPNANDREATRMHGALLMFFQSISNDTRAAIGRNIRPYIEAMFGQLDSWVDQLATTPTEGLEAGDVTRPLAGVGEINALMNLAAVAVAWSHDIDEDDYVKSESIRRSIFDLFDGQARAFRTKAREVLDRLGDGQEGVRTALEQQYEAVVGIVKQRNVLRYIDIEEELEELEESEGDQEAIAALKRQLQELEADGFPDGFPDTFPDDSV